MLRKRFEITADFTKVKLCSKKYNDVVFFFFLSYFRTHLIFSWGWPSQGYSWQPVSSSWNLSSQL